MKLYSAPGTCALSVHIGREWIAAPYLYVLLRWAEEGPGALSAYPGLSRFRARMESDGAVQRALEGEGMLPLSPAA